MGRMDAFPVIFSLLLSDCTPLRLALWRGVPYCDPYIAMIFRTWETLGQLLVAGPRRQIQDTRQRDPMHPSGCYGKPRQTHYTGL